MTLRSFEGLEKRLEAYVESKTTQDRYYTGSVPIFILYSIIALHNETVKYKKEQYKLGK